MSLFRWPILLILALTATHAVADTENRYQEMLQSEAHAQTVRSLGFLMLALPHERETVYPQFERYFWINQVDVEISDSVRELEASRLADQVDDVEAIVEERNIDRLELAGFTQVGTIRNLDLFYAADSASGPVMIRASIAFIEDGPPRFHSLRLFTGWDEVRTATGTIQHKADRQTASVTYRPNDVAEDEIAEPDQDDEQGEE